MTFEQLTITITGKTIETVTDNSDHDNSIKLIFTDSTRLHICYSHDEGEMTYFNGSKQYLFTGYHDSNL